jgi:hypothetical protein
MPKKAGLSNLRKLELGLNIHNPEAHGTFRRLGRRRQRRRLATAQLALMPAGLAMPIGPQAILANLLGRQNLITGQNDEHVLPPGPDLWALLNHFQC